MKPKLKEEPKEWQKFALVLAVLVSFIALALNRKGRLTDAATHTVVMMALVLLVTCGLRPRWFRAPYRVGMTLSFHVGQFMGRIMLTLFFLVAVTPLGLVLRLLGKDLLNLKRQTSATSYWRPAKTSQRFERLF